jgi:Flp pilus assembly protein TadD
MSLLPHPNNIYFDAAVGWMMLGNPREAIAELEYLDPASRQEPEVLELEWTLHARTGNWDRALAAARSLLQVAPENPSGWIHQAYSLRRVAGGSLSSAWSALLPAAKMFPRESIIRYNLACYAAQMNQPDDAWDWLKKAVAVGDKNHIRAMAETDPDLIPLKERLKEL